MKQLFITFMALLLFVGCDNNAEVKQFVADLATAVNNKDKAKIEKMYPNAAKCDSFSLDFNVDSMKIAKTDKPNVLEIELGKCKLVVEKKDDGIMTVNSSTGLFAFPKEKIDFAQKTGMWEAEIDDAILAERLADEDFQKFLIENFNKQVAKDFKVEGNPRVIKEAEFALIPSLFNLTVANNTNFAISGKDYKVHI